MFVRASAEFWADDARYTVRKVPGNGVVGPGVHIIREDGSGCQQGVLELVYNGPTVTLRQWDGDLDCGPVIARDQEQLNYSPIRRNIWREIWKVALSA